MKSLLAPGNQAAEHYSTSTALACGAGTREAPPGALRAARELAEVDAQALQLPAAVPRHARRLPGALPTRAATLGGQASRRAMGQRAQPDHNTSDEPGVAYRVRLDPRS